MIGRKIYYDLLTGAFLFDTGERSIGVQTTTEEDYAISAVLSARNPETVGCRQLEYEQYREDFLQSNGRVMFDVSVEPHQILFDYVDMEATDPEESYVPPLSVKVELQRQQAETQQQQIDDLQQQLLAMQEAINLLLGI